MITRPVLWIWLAFLVVSMAPLSQAQDTGFQRGSTSYNPQQLQELLAGQNTIGVINFFGRMPNHVRGLDWFYENLVIYIQDLDQYYTVAVICFSKADGRVWQVVCYPN